LASYLNLWLLWRSLRREGIFVRQPGWAKHFARLAIASVALAAVLLIGMSSWPDWSAWSTGVRIERLAVLIFAAGFAYVGALLAAGLRPRDLRGI
jgi:putative peptidoglycan lipid II flippase